MIKLLNTLVEFQKNTPDIYIGGSISLMLQNIIPHRIPKDIDIITPIKQHIYDIFNIESIKYPHIRLHKHNNFKWELFYNPNAQYLEYIYNDNIIKISPTNEIFEWKYKFQKKSPNNIKNNNDINYYKQWLTMNSSVCKN
jgi:hypothetical protein